MRAPGGRRGSPAGRVVDGVGVAAGLVAADAAPAADDAVAPDDGEAPEGEPVPLTGGPGGRVPDWLAGWFPGRARRDRLLTLGLPHVRSMGRRRRAGRRGPAATRAASGGGYRQSRRRAGSDLAQVGADLRLQQPAEQEDGQDGDEDRFDRRGR